MTLLGVCPIIGIMTSPKVLIDFDDLYPPHEQCTCGRRFGDLHCPYCGCATVRGVPSRNGEAVLPNGQTLRNCVYCCRKCGRYFDDMQRGSCRAPLPKTVGRPHKTPVVAQKIETVPDDVQATLQKWAKQNPLLNQLLKEQEKP